MVCGKQGFLQLRHARSCLGTFAWWLRRWFFAALEERLRGTAMGLLHKKIYNYK